MPEQSPTRFTMVPARRSSEPTARRRARRILGALFLAAGLSVAALVVAIVKGGAPAPDLSRVDPKGRDLAYTAAVNFLAGKVQDVPHAVTFDPEQASVDDPSGKSTPLDYRSLNWVGFTPQSFGTKDLGFANFEVHHFLVVLNEQGQGASQAPPSPPGGTASPSAGGRAPAAKPSGTPSPGSSASPPTAPAASPGPTAPGTTGSPSPRSNVLQLDVPVLLDPSGPRLAASPAFSIWRNGEGEARGKGDYTNFSGLTTDVSEAGKNQILRWATAYATGDSAGLLTVTGDQNGKHHYEGLTGFSLANSAQAVQILSAIEVDNGQLVVRVRIMLARAQQTGTVPGKKGTAAQPFTTFADFDLLVGARGAQPPVLAWGPAGAAADLDPYQNATNN